MEETQVYSDEEIQEAKDKLNKLNKLQVQYENIEDEMVDLALKYNIPLYLEGRGDLLLADYDWSYKGRGEWYTSTDSCS